MAALFPEATIQVWDNEQKNGIIYRTNIQNGTEKNFERTEKVQGEKRAAPRYSVRPRKGKPNTQGPPALSQTEVSDPPPAEAAPGPRKTQRPSPRVGLQSLLPERVGFVYDRERGTTPVSNRERGTGVKTGWESYIGPYPIPLIQEYYRVLRPTLLLL